jgi:hypothetical protein
VIFGKNARLLREKKQRWHSNPKKRKKNQKKLLHTAEEEDLLPKEMMN